MSNKTHKDTADFFDRIAEDYKSRSEGKVWNTSSLSFARRQELVECALGDLPEGSVVLDYGMGPAVFADCAVKRKCRYIGIDISQKMIELAEEKGLQGCTYRQGDLSVLSDYRSQAGAVLLIGLIDYLSDPFEGLRVLGECVKPGGCLIMSFRNKYSLPFVLREVAKKLWRLVKGKSSNTERAFEADVLENAFSAGKELIPYLRTLGFDKFSVSFLDASPVFFRVHLPKTLWRLLYAMDRALSVRWLSYFAASGVLKAVKRQ